MLRAADNHPIAGTLHNMGRCAIRREWFYRPPSPRAISTGPTKPYCMPTPTFRARRVVTMTDDAIGGVKVWDRAA